MLQKALHSLRRAALGAACIFPVTGAMANKEDQLRVGSGEEGFITLEQLYEALQIKFHYHATFCPFSLQVATHNYIAFIFYSLYVCIYV